MAIKVVFPADSHTATVQGLFQWDYGQVLEIEAADMGNEIVEVHFACTNMSEAIVRPCSFSNGIGTVTIPDQCLEQASTITAWVYKIVGTEGHTVKTITLPITARTRPSVARDIPQEVSNRYTELITEVNEAVDDLEKGKITVAKAINADTAARATTAGNASSANYATSAGSAATATKAYQNEKGKSLSNILSCAVDGYTLYDRGLDAGANTIEGGLIAFRISCIETDSDIRLITEVGGSDTTSCCSPAFYDKVPMGKNTGIFPMRLVFDNSSYPGTYAVKIQRLLNGAWAEMVEGEYPVRIYYKYLSALYPVG